MKFEIKLTSFYVEGEHILYEDFNSKEEAEEFCRRHYRFYKYCFLNGIDILKREELAKKIVGPVNRNKLNLIPGKIGEDIDVSNLPKPVLDYSNSVYDARLKRRVPILAKVDNEIKEVKKDEKKKNEVKREQVEDGMINNTDNQEHEDDTHSSDFLEPEVCTRLWVLDTGIKGAWAWFLRPIDGFKNKLEFYCRPIELKENWHKKYERGGSFVTYAYLKSDFEKLDNEVLSHSNLQRLKSKIENHTIEINYLIDAFLINW